MADMWEAARGLGNVPLIPVLVLVPLVMAVVLNLLYKRDRASRISAIVAATAILFLIPIIGYGYHWFAGQPMLSYPGGLLQYSLSLEYVFLAPQQIMVLTLALMFFVTVLSAAGEVERRPGPYLGILMLNFMATAIVLLVNDMYHLWIAVEIASLAAVGLAAATGEPSAHNTGLKYLFIGGFCVALLAIIVSLLVGYTGVTNITDMGIILSKGLVDPSSPVMYVAFGFSVLVWAYAGGLIPVHPIKSELYRVSMPHAAGFLQTQSKFMIVGIGVIMLRLFGPTGVNLPYSRAIMLAIGVGTMIFGVTMAIVQDDYRRLLAYHAISQGGYVAAGIALGTELGIMGGAFHAINHVIYKTALFLGCGAVLYRTKTASLKEMGGLLREMPIEAFLLLCAKFAISGIPPLNGFQSKVRLMEAAMEAGMPEVTIIMLLVSITTFVSMFKAFYLIFLQPKPKSLVGKELPKVPMGTRVGMIILVFLCLLLGFFPELATDYLAPLTKELGRPWV